MSHVQERLARLLDVGGIRLADGTALEVAGYAGCEARSHFSGFARYGYARSEHRFIWGVRLILLTDERGLPLGYTIVPANEHEREPLADLLTGVPAAVVVADKGFWGEAFRARLEAGGVRLLTPDRVRTARQPGLRAGSCLHPPGDRKRLFQPQGPDGAGTAPGPDGSWTGSADRPADPGL